MIMNYELLLIVVLFLALLCKLWMLCQEYRPHIATILLPEGHTKFFLEYWEHYSWYDKNGNQLWSKRIKRKYLFIL